MVATAAVAVEEWWWWWWRNGEGTGFVGRVEGSFGRQDWKVGITRVTRNLSKKKRFLIFFFY